MKFLFNTIFLCVPFFSLLQLQASELPESLALSIKYGYSLRENGKGYKERNGTIFRRQEDKIACKNNNFFSLFDGHGGELVSSLLKINFFTYFNGASAENVTDKLETAFAMADNRIPDNDENKGLYYGSSGSTALVAYISEKEGKTILTTAHAGDSRLVLAKGNEVAYETVDHNCSNEKEVKRIKDLGGEISNGSSGMRVNGVEVTRAIGDKEIRDNVIIPIPEIQEI